MKRELLRKDELIKKHYEKLGDWQALLQDMQGSNTSASNSGSTAATANTIVGTTGRVSGGPGGVSPGMNIPAPSDGPGGQPAGFVPGNNYRTNIPGSSMQTPLAYLDSMTRK